MIFHLKCPRIKSIQIQSMLNSWSDFYSEEVLPSSVIYHRNSTFNSTSSKLISNTDDLYISQCTFYDMSSTTDGGAIYSSILNAHILVESSIFQNCSTLGTCTAAIRVNGGNCAITHVCGTFCKAKVNDGFCSVSTNENIKTNVVLDSSVCHCESGSAYTMVHRDGYIQIKSLNVSHNFAGKQASALESIPNKINPKTGLGTLISYSSIVNNTANERLCLLLSSTFDHELRNSNFLSNSGADAIKVSSSTNIKLCAILDNKNTPIFIGSITLINCTVSKDQLKDSTPNIDNIHISSFIHALPFIETGNCINKFDNFLFLNDRKHHCTNLIFHSFKYVSYGFIIPLFCNFFYSDQY